MKQFRSHTIQLLPYVLITGLLLWHPTMRDFTLSNIAVQLLLFVPVVILPAIRTGRMSYVDIGWPIGLFLIGAQTLYFGETGTLRTWLVAFMYLFIGGRMGLMALVGWRLGMLNRELPRYQYQRLRWQRRGWAERPALLFEVSFQGIANMSLLALPAIYQASNPEPGLSVVEVLAGMLWLAAFCFEFVADAQKLKFGLRMKREGRKGMHCDEGLWKYSRHPNYFGEWMVWNALCLGTGPTLLWMAATQPWWLSGLGAASLAFLSWTMYAVLTHYSGAVPSEYYSVRKRPGYARYQQTTNQFFPGPPRQPD